MLEEQSLRPLMFFLHCLSDDDEIDSLIKREIDCRTRFILCDSENARSSHWVQKEVEYIKSQNRICETIDLSQSLDDIMATLQDFINKTRIFISYNREEFQLADMVYHRLLNYDFSVYMDKAWDFNNEYHQNYADAIEFLESSVVKSNGYIVAIMNERILNPTSSSRYEQLRAIHDNRSEGKDTPNIIPFVINSTVADEIKQDEDLKPLVDCNIQVLCGSTMKEQCDEILKRVVTQLMEPGSIKVLADNLAKGTFHKANKEEAAFLYRLTDSNFMHILRSESGEFHVDDNGIVHSFVPADDNPFIKEDTVICKNYETRTSTSIRTFIVPEGVKGFESDFLRGVKVLERFKLPEGLLSIGNNLLDIETGGHCVFADCILPEVVIPQSVREIGFFAFGGSHIETLQLPATLHSPYGRQFKDSYISTLRLPKEWEGCVDLNDGHLYVDKLPDYGDYGYLGWPSTSVGNLEFY